MSISHPPVLLIGGHPRSGTTMLSEICNTHPQIAITHELKCYVKLDKPAEVHIRHLKKQGALWSRTFMKLSIAPRARRKTSLGWIRSMRLLGRYQKNIRRLAKPTIDASDVSRELACLFPDATMVGDKYPGYVFMLDRLVDIPATRIVIIYRDCRDVALSCFAKAHGPWRGTRFGQRLSTAEGVANNWLRAVNSMEKHADKIYMLKYETLARNQESEMHKIGQWLGVEPQEFRTEAIHSDSVGRYRKELASRDRDIIENIAGEKLSSLGYSI